MHSQLKRFCTIIYLIHFAWGISAFPEKIILTQPNGLQFECFVKGDEWANWHETTDGWSIVKNEHDYWVYAEGILGKFLLPGNSVVGQNPPPVNMEKHLMPVAEFRPNFSSNINLQSSRTDTFKVPVIFFQFPDYSSTYSITEIAQVFNQEGYGHPGNPGSGSFREYYEEISYGQFSPQSMVMGIFTAPNNHDYYGSDGQNYNTRVRQLVRAMVDSAEAAGFDWSDFDNDGDGDVDGVTLVHAGPGAEQGDGSNIWSHRWSLGSYAVTHDGVFINDYNITPETQSNNIVAIGVIAHEFGHVLGLPDLYDTDYSSAGSGKLALMASGSWGTVGNTPWYPSSMNAWCKTELNWTNVESINSEQTYNQLEQSFSSNVVYRVDNPTDESEYWLIENRQNRGTDVLMPETGLLIWHIDIEKTSQGWAPNNDEPHYGVGLEQADGLLELENNGDSDRGDPFPGLTDNRAFTHCTQPSTVSYYGEASMMAMTNISDSDSIMSFDLSFDFINTGSMSGIGFGDAYSTGYLSISMTNNVAISDLNFELNMTPDILTIENIALTGRASADSIIVTDHTIELVNPNIPAGNGEIFMLTVFAQTGSDGTINIEADEIQASDSDGNMVCFTFEESSYLVNEITQEVAVDSIGGEPGEAVQVAVSLTNVIPIKMFMITIADSPDRLTPTYELYNDANGNGHHDAGEMFADFNGDGQWTDVVENTVRTATWNLSYQISNVGILVAGLNSLDTIAVGEGPIFKILYMIDNDAPAGIVNMLLTNVNLTDIFGNYNLQYNGFNGVFMITSLNTEENAGIPKSYSMSNNYPNPFNPITQVNFDIPEFSEVAFTIYSLLGEEVFSVTAQYTPGRYQFTWNGRDQLGHELPSGVYLLKMHSRNFQDTRKLVLMK